MPHAFRVLDQAPDVDAIVYCTDACDGQPTGSPEWRFRQNSRRLQGQLCFIALLMTKPSR
jgi:hypothetical protein